MGMLMDYESLKALEGLLSGPDSLSRQDENMPPAQAPQTNGRSSASNSNVPRQPSSDNKAGGGTKKKADPSPPTDSLPAVEPLEDENEDDGRLRPEYGFVYKQAISANDAYLGMSDKDPSTLSCEDLLLRVQLPGTASAKEIDLDLQPTWIKLKTEKFKLAMYLPHRVESQRGRAKWDSSLCTLEIAMPIIRDLGE